MKDLKEDRYWCEFGTVTGLWFVYDRRNPNYAVDWVSRKENAEKIVRQLNQEQKDHKECTRES